MVSPSRRTTNAVTQSNAPSIASAPPSMVVRLGVAAPVSGTGGGGIGDTTSRADDVSLVRLGSV